MNRLAHCVWLLADRSRWERLGDAFSEENAQITFHEMISLVCIVVAGLLVIVVLRVLAQRQEEERPYCDPERLFRELCRLHRLSRKERHLVRRLAEESQLEMPSLIFVQPERFESAELGEPDADRQAQIRRLRGRLFA